MVHRCRYNVSNTEKLSIFRKLCPLFPGFIGDRNCVFFMDDGYSHDLYTCEKGRGVEVTIRFSSTYRERVDSRFELEKHHNACFVHHTDRMVNHT